jgi:hypothetical protein
MIFIIREPDKPSLHLLGDVRVFSQESIGWMWNRASFPAYLAMPPQMLLHPGPVPPPFKDAGIPPFVMVRQEQRGRDLLLHYVLESGGPPVNVRSKALHETLPGLVEVSVGGWYGTMGQWSLLERYLGVVEFRSVSHLSQVAPEGTRADFFLEKRFWGGLRVTVESEQLGLFQFRCKAATPLDYQTLVFDKKRHLWVDKVEMLNALGIPYQP